MPYYVLKHKLFATHFLTVEGKLVINDLDVVLMNSYELYESSKSNALQQSVNYFSRQQIWRQKYFK